MQKANRIALGTLHPGAKGIVVDIGENGDDDEIPQRLREMGFVENAAFEVLHDGPFGGNPMAVRVEQMILALRRSEADLILVELEAS